MNQVVESAIDWIDASRRSPLADLARSTILVLGAADAGQIQNPLVKASTRIFHAVYIHHYFKLRLGGEREYRHWLPIVAAARLSEGIPELETWLVAQAEKGRSTGSASIPSLATLPGSSPSCRLMRIFGRHNRANGYAP
jgi:hypothetical protein